MYKDYFGFTENPFSIAPDPRYLYMSEMHQEALAQKVSWDFAVAATVTEIPENPNENKITIAMIGMITKRFGKLTPIANAIPMIKLACNAEIKEIASIFPSAMDERETGDVNALFINP